MPTATIYGQMDFRKTSNKHRHAGFLTVERGPDPWTHHHLPAARVNTLRLAENYSLDVAVAVCVSDTIALIYLMTEAEPFLYEFHALHSLSILCLTLLKGHGMTLRESSHHSYDSNMEWLCERLLNTIGHGYGLSLDCSLHQRRSSIRWAHIRTGQ